jgi:hypothetical protein
MTTPSIQEVVEKLRKALEAEPTMVDWMWDSDPIKGDPLSRDRFRVVARGRTITQIYYSSGDPQAQADAAWIAAANPTAILALLTAHEEAMKDAERYRWLRFANDEQIESLANAEGIIPEGKAFDSAIDASIRRAALAANKEQP